METKEIVCFCCPRRCRIEAKRMSPSCGWKICGNGCENGRAFALKKLAAPPEK